MIKIIYKCGHSEKSNCYDGEKKEQIKKLLYHIRHNRLCIICAIKEQTTQNGGVENIASVYTPPESKAESKAEKIKSYSEAYEMYKDAVKTSNIALEAYKKAWEAYKQAEKVYTEMYNEAGKMYNEARMAYNEARRKAEKAYNDELITLYPPQEFII